jgi:hypothetical protein
MTRQPGKDRSMTPEQIKVLAAAVCGLALSAGLSACNKAPVAASAAPPAASTASAAAVSAASVAPVSAAPLANADADQARAFLVKLYAGYAKSDGPPTFERPGDYFDPPMLALMDEDKRLTAKGDEGALDFDPVCSCQDPSGMTYKIDSVTAANGAAKAVVTVSFVSPGVPPNNVRITFDLAQVNGQWRIHDIGDPDTPSLRGLFIQSNKAQSHP